MLDYLVNSEFLVTLYVAKNNVILKKAMITEIKITQIFVMADDFCKLFYQMMENSLYQI